MAVLAEEGLAPLFPDDPTGENEVKDKKDFLLKLSHSDNEVLLPWVIFHLQKIGDARAIEALRRLTRHQQKEKHDLPPVDEAARLSLERIESRVDLATLNGVLDAPARITLIRRLMQGENRVAQSGVRKFLMVIIEVHACLRAFGDEGLKALKPVLYSRTHLARMDAVQIISQAGNEAALELLTEFDASVENHPEWQDKNLKLRLKEGLQLLREELKQ